MPPGFGEIRVQQIVNSLPLEMHREIIFVLIKGSGDINVVILHDDNVHSPDIFASFLYDTDSFFQCFQGLPFIKSLDVVKDLLCSDPSLLSNPSRLATHR